MRRSIFKKSPPTTQQSTEPKLADLIAEEATLESSDQLGSLGAPAMKRSVARKDSSPRAWQDYFEKNYTLPRDSSIINCYYTAPKPDGVLFVCVHGAGSSGLTFALLNQFLQQESQGADGVLTYDMRGHGLTIDPPGPVDYSLASLGEELIDVIEQSKEKLQWPESTKIILVGHSLGGAVAVQVALADRLANVSGVATLDVVEGTALESLASMNTIISNRPKSFPTVEDAIHWHVKSMTIRNSQSARVSVLPTLIAGDSGKFYWRTDLKQTERYWRQWFTDLSQKFLKAKGARLLVLAGTDRLDKELIIGQMQGKYQLVVFRESGHFVQEDVPLQLAVTLHDFAEKFTRQVHIPSWTDKKKV